jgi:hypothetical protein
MLNTCDYLYDRAMPALSRKVLTTDQPPPAYTAPAPVYFTLPDELAEKAIKILTEQNDGFLLLQSEQRELETILARNLRNGRQMVDAVRALKALGVGGIEVDVPLNVWARLKSRYPVADDLFAIQIEKVIIRLLEEHTYSR